MLLRNVRNYLCRQGENPRRLESAVMPLREPEPEDRDTTSVAATRVALALRSGFKTRLGNRLSWLKGFLIFLSSLPAHIVLLAHSVQFTIR